MRESINLKKASQDDWLGDRVRYRHGWCEITPLSGELEEGIYMATFADDSRILFEVGGGELSLMLTKEQRQLWNSALDSDKLSTLEEIVYFFLRDDINR